jgi:hypothetical protein
MTVDYLLSILRHAAGDGWAIEYYLQDNYVILRHRDGNTCQYYL